MNYAKNLKGDYLIAYDELMTELSVEALAIDFEQEVKNDLLDMLLSAQEDEIAPIELVGENRKEFIEGIVSDFNKRNSIEFRVLQYISYLFMGIFTITLINSSFSEMTVNITLDMVLCILIFSVCDTIGRILSRKYKLVKSRKHTKWIFEWGFFFLFMMISIVITSNLNLEPLVTTNPLYILIPSFIFYLITMGISNSKYK